MKTTSHSFSNSYSVCVFFILFLVSSQICLSKTTAPADQSQWKFVRDISVENRGSQLRDAVILIELNGDNFDYSKAKEDGSDIRFSTKANKLAGSGLSYWIEQWNTNGISRIWVKIPKLAKNKTMAISMIYGNATANAVTNGEATFLFFDDFNDNTITGKWKNLSIESVVEEGGLLKLKEHDGENGMILSDFDVTGQMVVRALYQRENGDRHWVRSGISGWNHWLSWGDYYTTDGYADGYLMIFNDSVNNLLGKTTTLHPDDKWYRLTYFYDGSKLKGYRENDSVEFSMPNASSKLGIMTLDNDAADLYDYITVANYITTEPAIQVGKERPSSIK